MNKYKSALSDIMCCVPYGKLKEQEEILIELVEKATPKKPFKKNRAYLYCPDGSKKEIYLAHCPNCKDIIEDYVYHSYCPICGQALDWSAEDEEQRKV